MAISASVNFEGLKKALDSAPDAIVRALTTTVRGTVEEIQDEARSDHRFTTRSGMAERSITAVSSGLRGRVELDTGIAPYSPILHNGSGVYGPSGKPIPVSPRRAQALRFVLNGGFAFSKGHEIQGVKGDPFLYRAADRVMPRFTNRVNLAIGRVLRSKGL